ncbi:MAG: TetR/AcrR family transcriptional regulator, partial [Cyanobacteria bacterium P01_E01_bin.34]
MSRGPSKQFDPDVALQQAMEVFWAKGYEAASLSELMARMGISKKSLYDTFGNKRSLFLKALEHYSRTVLQDMNSQLAGSGSPLRNLETLFQELQVMHSQPRSHGCMLGTNIADFDSDDEEVASVLRGYLTQLESIYARAIRQAQ